MIHSFRCMDRYFLLDVPSGSLFEIDESAHKLAVQSHSDSRFDKNFGAIATQDNIDTARELDSLVADGVLCTDEPVELDKKAQGYKAMCLNICHDCNLACQYCFAADNVAQSTMMSIETAKRALDMLVELSGNRRTLEVDFFGGEPTLNFDVVKQAVEYAHSLETKHDKRFRFTITTNALLLTDEMMHFLNKEMYNVVLSIDGRESTHNTLRPTKGRANSYSPILDNIRKFAKIRGNGQYYVRGTFTAHNLDFAKDVLALHDLGFDQISLEPVVLDAKHPLAIRKEHISAIHDEYETLAKEYLRRRQSKDTWFNFFHFYIDLKGGPCASKRLSGCGAGCEYIAVAPSGDIYPCHQMVGSCYHMGDLDKGIDISLKDTLQNVDITSKPKCQACFAKYYCSGGCLANASAFGTGIDGTYDIACDIIQKRVECALAIYAIESNGIA